VASKVWIKIKKKFSSAASVTVYPGRFSSTNGRESGNYRSLKNRQIKVKMIAVGRAGRYDQGDSVGRQL
jgi:hypothetical protein